MPVEAIVIAAIVVAKAVLGFVQQARAEDAVAAVAKLTAATSTVRRGGRFESVPSAQLVRGDILVLSEGDAVGADARLLEASALRVQESSLTGESEASDKSAEPLPRAAALGDRRNMVYRGTAIVQGVGRAVVVSTGMDTEMGRIADLLDRTEAEPSPLQSEVAAVSRSLGIIVVGIAVVVMAAIVWVNGVSTPQDMVTVLLLGLSLAVAAVPEGLPAILSLVLAIGVRGMARRNAVMKDLHSVETLGRASVICSDKTGTLTKNEMTLTRVVTASGEVEVTETGVQVSATSMPGTPSFRRRCWRRSVSSSADRWPTTRSCTSTMASGRSKATQPRPPFWSRRISSATSTRRRATSTVRRRSRSAPNASGCRCSSTTSSWTGEH